MKATEQYFPAHAAYYVYKVVLTFESWVKSSTVTIQINAKELYKSAMVFLFAFPVVMKQYLVNQAWFHATFDFSNQFPFP